MSLIWIEGKKLLNWRRLILLALLNLILLFPLYEIMDLFPNGRPETDGIRLAQEIKSKYGTIVDEEEFEDFKKSYEERLAAVSTHLSTYEVLVEAGFTDYQSFMSYGGNKDEDIDLANAIDEIREQIFFKERINVFWEAQEQERLISAYERTRNGYIYRPNHSSADLAVRIQEQLQAEGKYEIYPESFFNHFQQYITYVAMMAIINAIIVMLPLYMQDKQNRVEGIQYASRRGRRLFGTKLASGVLSVVFLTLLLVIGSLLLYSFTGNRQFFDIPISSIITGFTWYNITFGQYFVLSYSGVIVLALLFGILTACLSRLVGNYMTLIGLCIPIFFLQNSYGNRFMVESIIDMRQHIWLSPIMYLSLLIGTLLLLVFIWRREGKRNIT